MKRFITSALVLTLLIPGASSAAPTITNVSGTLTHGSAVTVSGSGFGAKTQAAPVVWDDASTGLVPADTYWDDCWPNTTDNPDYYCRYTIPIRGVNLPHSHISRYMTGGHGPDGWSLDVGPFRSWQLQSYPTSVYLSYYYRIDPNWNFCSGDSNHKMYSHAQGGGPYVSPYWYMSYENNSLTGASVGDLGWTTSYIPDGNGPNHTFLGLGQTYDASNPLVGWVKIEVEVLYTDSSSGYVKVWHDGRQGTTFNGATDAGGVGWKTEGVGGYARCYGYPDNWRYFADIYFDTSRARILLGNASTYAASTIREIQIPSAWSDTALTLTTNLGQFTTGTAYLYVVDSTGAVNATGYPVTVGGTPDTTPPSAPANLAVE